MRRHILPSVPDGGQKWGAAWCKKAMVRTNQPLPVVLEGSKEKHLFLGLLL